MALLIRGVAVNVHKQLRQSRGGGGGGGGNGGGGDGEVTPPALLHLSVSERGRPLRKLTICWRRLARASRNYIGMAGNEHEKISRA